MTTHSDEFVPFSPAEMARMRAPGPHLADRIALLDVPALSPADLARIAGQGSGVGPVDLCPADLLARPAPPLSPQMRRWERSAARALCGMRADRVREYVAQQNALDAPFQDLARSRFYAGSEGFTAALGASAGAARGAAEAAGVAELDTSKTKAASLREEIEIDRLLSRVRRLGKAVRNSAHALDSAAHLSGGFLWRRLFVTLTYREVDDWKPGHVREFTRYVRDWFRRKTGVPMRMVWVLELQKRGAVHYHCMLWIPARCRFPNPAAAGWWKHGFSHVAAPKGGIQRPVSYMAKYASKVTSDQAARVPKGARMHGACGLDQEGKRWVRFWRAPLFARDALGGAADIRKVTGGYMDKLTGEFCASPWKVTVTPGGRVIAWRLLPPTTEAASAAIN